MGRTGERGYGTEHQKLRKRWSREVAAGVVACARCGRPIVPGTPWDLDHAPGKAGYLGPSAPALQPSDRDASSGATRVRGRGRSAAAEVHVARVVNGDNAGE
jgi:hypothetical protein